MTIDYAWRQENIGRILNNSIFCFEQRVFEILEEKGQNIVRRSDLHLTRNLDIEGSRSIVIAQRAAMSKQAVSQIVARCEKIGLVHRVPDPSDARAKVVRFTVRGLEWLEEFHTSLQQAEAEMIETLGAEPFAILKRALSEYTADMLATGQVARRSLRKLG